MTDETLLTSSFLLPRGATFYARGAEDRADDASEDRAEVASEDRAEVASEDASELASEDASEDGAEDGAVPALLWLGMGDEFRNRIARLTAGTLQLREHLPREAASDFAPALADMESSLDGLAALVRCMDAVIIPGEQIISDLADVLERAVILARPWLRRDVRVIVGSRVGAVRNRGGAVELALATVMVSLAREPRPAATGLIPELNIEARSGRGLLVIEIDSNGARPAPGWRWLLAERLAASVGGTLELLPDRVGAELRFQ